MDGDFLSSVERNRDNRGEGRSGDDHTATGYLPVGRKSTITDNRPGSFDKRRISKGGAAIDIYRLKTNFSKPVNGSTSRTGFQVARISPRYRSIRITGRYVRTSRIGVSSAFITCSDKWISSNHRRGREYWISKEQWPKLRRINGTLMLTNERGKEIVSFRRHPFFFFLFVTTLRRDKILCD